MERVFCSAEVRQRFGRGSAEVRQRSEQSMTPSFVLLVPPRFDIFFSAHGFLVGSASILDTQFGYTTSSTFPYAISPSLLSQFMSTCRYTGMNTVVCPEGKVRDQVQFTHYT